MSQDNGSLFTDADLIYAYTRADALRDGVLVELPQASAYGFRVPVAITCGAYAACVDWPDSDPQLDSILRLREDHVLVMAAAAARAHRRRLLAGAEERPDRIDFDVDVMVLQEGGARLVSTTLYMVIGPGDGGEPVGTILLMGED